MRKEFRNISIVASALLTSTLLFTGCGGGGGSSDDTTAAAAGTTITGKAVDGYLKNSLVWLDLDADGIHDSNEPSDISDENGAFHLKITPQVKNDPGFPTAKIVAEGGVDKDTGKRFNGKLLAPNTGDEEINLTPVTTLVAKLVERGEDVKKAEEKVKKSLGISEHVNLFDDPKKLEKEGQNELIAAALSLQKSIEMIAAAASGHDEEKAAEIQEKLYDAFAKVLAEEKPENENGSDADNGTAESGVAGLLEAAKKSDALDEVDVEDSHLDRAKELAQEVEDAVEEGHDSGKVEKAAALYTEQNTISGTVTAPDFGDLISKADELERKFLIYRLNDLGLDDTETLAQALLAAGFDADKLIDPTDETLEALKNSEKFQKVYAALIKERKDVEEEAEDAAAEAGEAALAIKAGDVFYEIDVDDEDGKVEFEFQAHTLGTDGKVREDEKVFVDGQWKTEIDDDSDYILTANGWVKESGNETYKINPDGSVTINNAFKISIAKEKDISGTYTLVLDGKVYEIEMPTGAKEYVNTYETIADQYWAWNKEHAWGIDGQEYYASLEEFIQHQCGENWFAGGSEGGIAFAGAKDEKGNYVCDGTATSGKLFEVRGGDETHPSTIVSEDAGTWEIKTINGVKILVVHPTNPAYSDEDGETIFTEFDNAVWEGEYEQAGKKETWHSFNKVAFDTIADYIESMATDSTGGSAIDASQLITLLGGKTVYVVGKEADGSDFWGDTVVFTADMTQLSYSAFDGSEQGTDAIRVEGNKIVWTEDNSYMIISQKSGDYIEGVEYESDGSVESHTRIYFDRSKAEAYLNTLQAASGTEGGDSASSGDTGSGSGVTDEGMSEEEKALLDAAPVLRLTPGYTFYEIDAEKEDDGLEFWYGIYTLNNNGNIGEIEKYLDNNTWVDDDDDEEELVLTDDGWVSDHIESYSVNSDGSILIDGKMRIAVVKKTDIAGTYSYDLENGGTVQIEMPAGAVEYKNLYESLEDQYFIYEKRATYGNIESQEYYKTFSEFITHQCGTHWFVGHEFGGLAFKGTDDGNGNYQCDGSATSGTLVGVTVGDNGAEIVKDDAGSWEIKTVNGYRIMFIHPSNPAYQDDDEGAIFVEYNGNVWKGGYEKSGVKDIWTSYNETAFEAIKKAAEDGSLNP